MKSSLFDLTKLIIKFTFHSIKNEIQMKKLITSDTLACPDSIGGTNSQLLDHRGELQ